MIRLSKSKERQPILSDNMKETLSRCLGMFIGFAIIASIIGIPTYFVGFHIGEPARLIVRNIEDHPEQWTVEVLKDNPNNPTTQFVNQTVGVYTNVSSIDYQYSHTYYYNDDTRVSAFRTSRENALVARNLVRYVQKKQNKEELAASIITKLRDEK